MNLNDFIIIYLACGSPVGVWYYFNNKTVSNILTKSVLAAFFWIFFLAGNFYKKIPNQFQTEKIARDCQKEIEKQLPKKILIFDFREITDRYIGLTLAFQNKKVTSYSNNEFSARFNSRNKEISAKCLQRRNRQKLKLHQTSARKDFLQTIREISEQINAPFEFLDLNLKLTKNLNDAISENFIRELLQILTKGTVQQGEQEVWSTEQLNLPMKEHTNFHLPVSTRRTIQISAKD